LLKREVVTRGEGTGTGKWAGDRNRKGVRNRNRKGTSVGSSEAKGMKCDGNEWDQAGRGRNKVETNQRQSGSKPELAEKQMNSDSQL
jgi:hypothetical protein